MIQKKPSLGRGLGALMGATPPAAAPAVAETPPQPQAPAGDQLTRLPLDVLQRGKYQPRSHMEPEALQELADSIRSQGVVQPIVVRPVDGAGPGGFQRYEIIAGERRWRAAQLAGLPDIPVIIRRIPDETAIAVALIENIQRENLNPLEEARALHRLIDEFAMTHQQAAEAVGRSRAAVSNLLRLLELAPEVSQLVEQRQLEMGHARALLGLANRRQQVEVAGVVVKRGMSVRDTEAVVRRLQGAGVAKATADSEGGSADPDVRRLEQDLGEKLGATVLIQHQRGGKGKVVISYNSLDELDGIIAHIQ